MDFLKQDKNILFKDSIFSSPCILSNDKEVQGKNSLLEKDNPLYNDSDSLKCIGNYIGITITDNGANHSNIANISDSAECSINIDDVKIGIPSAGWKLSFIPLGTCEMTDFKIDSVLIDRTIGTYRIMLSLIKNNINSTIIRRNGGI